MIALLAGTAIIAWSGILVRFLDVGPLAGAAWRMGLAVPALAVWAGIAGRGQTQAPDLRRAAVPLMLAGLAFAVDVGSFHIAINGTSPDFSNYGVHRGRESEKLVVIATA